MAGDIFSDWVIWIRSNALHFDNTNVNNTAVFEMSVREAVLSSHSRCVSGSIVGNIKWFNIKSWTGTFKVNAYSTFIWLDTWLIIWRIDVAANLLT